MYAHVNTMVEGMDKISLCVCMLMLTQWWRLRWDKIGLRVHGSNGVHAFV
jgi:hypothetical protein